MRNFRRVPRRVKRCGSLLGETEYLRAMMFLAQVPTRAEDEALSAWEVQLPLQWDKVREDSNLSMGLLRIAIPEGWA